VRHDGPVSPYRKEQLSKIGIMAFEKHNPLVKLLDIDVSETVKEYYVKSGQYAVKKGLL
jgi:phosphoribosyl-dephospho-CoA transferase